MSRAASIAQGLVRGTGVLQLLLGIGIWTGIGVALTRVHMWIGILFVLALWILALLGARGGAGIGLALAALAWGVLTIAFGMAQPQILPGPNHWVIRVLHLLVGVGAMGLGDTIGRRIRRTGAPPARASVPVS